MKHIETARKYLKLKLNVRNKYILYKKLFQAEVKPKTKKGVFFIKL